MKTTKSEPTAKIAVKKNVLKQYRVDNEDVVYLAKDAEFEIELFNPLQETILAKISLNNKEIPGGGLILRPGERVFLERYLNEDKKFKFDVYQIENTQEAKNATAKNGLVTVKFFKENIPQLPVYRVPWYTTPTIFYGITYASSTPLIGTTTTSSDTSINCSTTSTADLSNKTRSFSKKSLDTGIIAKGSSSDQELEYVDMDFQYFAFHSIFVRILPDTRKPYTTEEIKYRKYCTECGSKIKATDKFCAECGTKL